MGGCTFDTFVNLPDASKAFNAAVEEARYQYGHGGYTGTIAEKHDFVVINKEPQTLEEAHKQADQLIADDDPRIYSKHDPAGAIKVVEDKRDGWLFFGWAAE